MIRPLGCFHLQDPSQLAKPLSIGTADYEHRLLSQEISRLEAGYPHLIQVGTAPFTRVTEAARKLGDAGLLARTLSMLSRAESFWGELEVSIGTGEEAIALFQGLAPMDQVRVTGPHAEAWRVVGNTRLKLGDIAASLPLLERGIAVAERGVEAAIPDEHLYSAIPATSALARGFNNLGMSLIGMREMGGAREALLQGLDVVEAHPEVLQDVPDDALFMINNLVDILHMHARTRLVAGESADELLTEARELLDTRAAKIIAAGPSGDGSLPKVSVLAERDFLKRAGQNLLLRGDLQAALEHFQQLAASSGRDHWRGAPGQGGLAETLLELGRPAEALAHAKLALAAYDHTEEVVDRADALLIVSRAHRALGDDSEALRTLEAHNVLRSRIDARAAQEYAGQMAARLGYERARAEAEAQRRIATELKALNAKLMQQASALEIQAAALSEARVAAEDASRAKSAFLANMSHELRTPLNAILGFSEMLRDNMAGPPGPAWSGYAGMIHEAGSHLLSVIGEILDLSKIEAGRVVLYIEQVDLPVLAETCRELIAPMLDRGGVEFCLDLDPAMSRIPADRVRLKQILLNLLSNATKFTPQGGRVTLSTHGRDNGMMEIRVTDTGTGMTAAELKLALEVFGQIESDVSRRHQGTGLGLPIAVGLAELHGGSLTVQSEKGYGTAVTVTLPTC
jgi:signal transduction histidine kinase